MGNLTEILTERCELESSDRGISFEMLKKTGMAREIKEIMVITTEPGSKRGNHYHKQKKEWLCVISGSARFVFVDNKTKERKELEVSGSRPLLVNIPVNVTHAIINTGKEEMVILEMSDREYSKDDTDNYKNEIA